MKRVFGFVVILLLGLFSFSTFVMAKCVPAQCPRQDSGGVDCDYGADEKCVANCCIAPGEGDGTNTSCLPSGTRVKMADGSEKYIENVAVGESVWSTSDKGGVVASKVSSIEKPVRDHMCKLDFADGGKLELTDEHPVFTRAGWKAINSSKTKEENSLLSVTDLLDGDEVKREDGGWSKISTISCRSEKVQTYNLILSGKTHTYYADGYLVHNKASDLGCTADQFACKHYYCEPNCWEDCNSKGCWPVCSGEICTWHAWECCNCSTFADTKPTNLDVTWQSNTTAKFTWTPGLFYDDYPEYQFVQTNLQEVKVWESGGAQVFYAGWLPKTQSELLITGLTAGKTYYLTVGIMYSECPGNNASTAWVQTSAAKVSDGSEKNLESAQEESYVEDYRR